MNEKDCHVMTFPADDVMRLSRDAALNSLLKEGWKIILQFSMQIGPESADRIVLVLSPPANSRPLVIDQEIKDLVQYTKDVHVPRTSFNQRLSLAFSVVQILLVAYIGYLLS